MCLQYYPLHYLVELLVWMLMSMKQSVSLSDSKWENPMSSKSRNILTTLFITSHYTWRIKVWYRCDVLDNLKEFLCCQGVKTFLYLPGQFFSFVVLHTVSLGQQRLTEPSLRASSTALLQLGFPSRSVVLQLPQSRACHSATLWCLVFVLDSKLTHKTSTMHPLHTFRSKTTSLKTSVTYKDQHQLSSRADLSGASKILLQASSMSKQKYSLKYLKDLPFAWRYA